MAKRVTNRVPSGTSKCDELRSTIDYVLWCFWFVAASMPRHPGTSVPGSPVVASGGVCAIRRAVGGSPRVLRLIAFCGVFALWRRPCRTHPGTSVPGSPVAGVSCVCVLLAIGDLCGVIRRAVGGSPRVSGFFAFGCVSLTGGIDAAARPHTPGHFRARLAWHGGGRLRRKRRA
jgi:hypothetical protein